jgi:hypothetical protein
MRRQPIERDAIGHSFDNSRDTDLESINHKLDLLAGLVAGLLNVETPQIFTNEQGEEER